jgi:hypothetical protein
LGTLPISTQPRLVIVQSFGFWIEEGIMGDHFDIKSLVDRSGNSFHGKVVSFLKEKEWSGKCRKNASRSEFTVKIHLQSQQQ